MKWKVLLVLTCVAFCFQGTLVAQEHCYETQRQKGIQLYNQGDYNAARKNFEAAKLCTDLPSNNDLDSWLQKCVIVVRLSVNELEFEAYEPEEQCVEVTTNAKTFRVGSTPSWCTIQQQGKTLVVSCEDNLTVAPRQAKVTVTASGKTMNLDINQQAADIEVDFQPESLLFPSRPETKYVVVNSNVIEWNVESVPSWLVAERKKDTLYIASTNNATSSYREAEIVFSFGEDTFPYEVRQQPGDTVIEVDRKELVFPKETNSVALKVESNIDTWNVENVIRWVKIDRTQDSVVVTADENPGIFSRHGQLRFIAGHRVAEVAIHQAPRVSEYTEPVSDLAGVEEAQKESITVNSVPSDLRVFIDDTIVKYTPFTHHVDYEHHSLQMGFERRDCFFNDKQGDIVFEPGLRFANLTFSSPKVIGLMSGVVTANSFGAYTHFQMSRPVVKEYLNDSLGMGGYHMTFGAVFQPIPFLGIYAGLGAGAYEGYPHIGLDYEAGVMGFFKNIMLTMGFHSSRLDAVQKRTKFMIGVGGYLKRYYDSYYGYCSSDSRPWWSVSYVARPAANGKGVMFGDLGKEKLRVYVKAMYLTPTDSVKNVDGGFGVMFTPTGGLIDLTLGVSASINASGLQDSFQGFGVEMGTILNFWRIPVSIMLHESDVFGNRHMYVDFGVGFHFGAFKRSSYK